MDLSFKRFQREYYQEYASWFLDPELNHRLGPMSEYWLSSILSQEEEKGITWVIFLNHEMVGVVETEYDPQQILPVAIKAIAIKPTRRRQGLAKAILEKLLSDHYSKGIQSHCAYIKKTNEASRHLFEGLGFMVVSEPDQNGFIELRHYRYLR